MDIAGNELRDNVVYGTALEKDGLSSGFDETLLGGVVAITGNGSVLDDADWGGALYRTSEPSRKPVTIKAIPYYAWDNRTPGWMRVWHPIAQPRY